MNIPLSKGLHAIVDDDCPRSVTSVKWHAVGHRRIYAARTVSVSGKRRYIYLHREIAGAPPGLDVDHHDGNTLNNRRGNLRVCTRSENLRNQRRRSKAANPYKGVWRNLSGRYTAYITKDYQRTHLGSFATAEEAAKAYNHAAAALHGRFAKLNPL